MAGEIALLLLAWGLYFTLHSLLASFTIKRWVARRWPRLLRGYRLLYNALALLLLLPIAWLTLAPGHSFLWEFTGIWRWLTDGLALVAMVGFLWSLRFYSGAEFLGTAQWRGRQARVEDQEAFRLSPLHRWVRHPWYFLGLVILWTRPMDPLRLTSALAITLYLVIGSRLEERKLISLHGARYRRYRQLVPALLPRPWRRLRPAEAEALLKE